MNRPPKLAERILATLLPSDRRDEVLGDLSEAHGLRSSRRGSLVAALWYWTQVGSVPLRLALSSRTAWNAFTAELRYVLRGLTRSPAFATVAILSLGIGIGANAAIFSALRAVVYTPLPIPAPEEMSHIYLARPTDADLTQYGSSSSQDPETGAQLSSNVSYPIYEELRTVGADAVDYLGYAFVRSLSITDEGRPALVAGGMLVSGDFYSTLGVSAALGRTLTTDDDRFDAPPVAVMSHSFWIREFGGDPDIIGRRVLMNGEPFEIVGISQSGYDGLSPGGFFTPSDVTVPLSSHPVFLRSTMGERTSLTGEDQMYWIRMMARIRDRERREPIRQELSVRTARIMVSTRVIPPSGTSETEIRFLPGGRGLDSLRNSTERPLAMIAGIAGLVLLIACANLATLMVARGAERSGEMAVRRAMGASRWRLLRPALLESLLLAFAGGAAGVIIAVEGGPWLLGALTVNLGRVATRVQPDGFLIATAILIALLAALLSSIPPALRLASSDPGRRMNDRSRGGSGQRLKVGRGLIVAQISVSLPLLVGAGLFLRTVANLDRLNPGFNAEGVILFQVDPSTVVQDMDEIRLLHRELYRQLGEISEVHSVSTVENLPVSGWISNGPVQVGDEEFQMYMNAVGPRYFETVETPLLSGRPIDDRDGNGGPLVAVVNERAEREIFGGRALGRRFETYYGELEVVGVVADSKYDDLRAEVEPTFYDPADQRPRGGARFYLLRSSLTAEQLAPTIGEVVASVHPQLPVTQLQSQTAQIRRAANQERLLARLLSLFGAFALLLACIGLHGVIAYAVRRRTAEIGVRMALGARPTGILRMVIRQVLSLAAIGIGVGVAVTVATGRIVESMLFGLAPTDFVSVAAAVLAMVAVAISAGWLPAWRASRLDPVDALTPSDGS